MIPLCAVARQNVCCTNFAILLPFEFKALLCCIAVRIRSRKLLVTQISNVSFQFNLLDTGNNQIAETA